MSIESEALKASADIADRMILLSLHNECWRIGATLREVVAEIAALGDSEDGAVVYTAEGILATILHCMTYLELDTDDDEIARNRAILDQLLDNPTEEEN